MKKHVLLLFALLVSACSAEQMPAAPFETAVNQVEIVIETALPTTVTEVDAPVETQTNEGEQPTSTLEKSHNLPDLSSVRLFEAAHLMDPSNFQVSLDGWPVDIANDLLIRIGEETFSCDILFPDMFPNRAYCWGKTPGKPGQQMVIRVYFSGVEEPLVEIDFKIPSPGAGGGG